MDEYIKRESLIAWLHNMAVSPALIAAIKNKERFPAADVVEVVHGEWTNIRDYGDYCLGHCSVCRTPQEVAFPSALKEGFRYCRWCGAKMDGKGD